MKRILLNMAAAMTAFGVSTTVTLADSNPIMGTISVVATNFCPRGWARADGQLLPISLNTALFSLYGTQFGGDGRTTFALPDLRGRVNVGAGNGPGLETARMAQKGGVESVAETIQTMPPHTHVLRGTVTGVMQASTNEQTLSDPANGFLPTFLASGANLLTTASDPLVPMGVGSVSFDTKLSTVPAGTGAKVTNQQPYLGMTTCIALQGLYPSRN